MFSHIFIGVTDFDKALAFYDPLMNTLGVKPRFGSLAWRSLLQSPHATRNWDIAFCFLRCF